MWKKKLSEAMEIMYDKANKLNGQVSGEHGIGYAKKRYLFNSLSEEMIAIMRGIKLAFDPKNILNPGKIAQ